MSTIEYTSSPIFINHFCSKETSSVFVPHLFFFGLPRERCASIMWHFLGSFIFCFLPFQGDTILLLQFFVRTSLVSSVVLFCVLLCGCVGVFCFLFFFFFFFFFVGGVGGGGCCVFYFFLIACSSPSLLPKKDCASVRSIS